MTWILPKQLHTLASALDTEALISDLAEQSQVCEQSLLVRSKHLPVRTWSRKWKRDTWTQHLSGRILKPSHTSSFTTEWTSSLEVTLANHLVPAGSEQEQTTQDTSGHSSQPEFDLCDPRSASLRTSKDTSRWDSPASSATWKNWVTKCRGEYSARLNAVRHTNASGSSFWPTASSRDWKDSAGMATSSINKDGSDRNRIDQLPRAVFHHHGKSLAGQQIAMTKMNAQSADLNTQKNANAPDQLKMESNTRSSMESYMEDQNNSGLADQLNSNSQASHQGSIKLNPRWVETLMGLPVGWVMPTCMSPVTIEPTNCDCSATELSQQLQNEHSELF